MEDQARRLDRRSDSAIDLLAAIAIGIGLAVLLAAWWST